MRREQPGLQKRAPGPLDVAGRGPHRALSVAEGRHHVVVARGLESHAELAQAALELAQGRGEG